ncbi:hypothetical protein PVAP13_8NG214800 [Panicum virgatum]|uniref:Uncharacterized protein n=1 Tax=Panicum virgatum TaxID=38727 RepID=A0A8T0PAG3_PANVG|nr:hypothetical protein PVAP13_8NG214800 [Panicum virgatum]
MTGLPLSKHDDEPWTIKMVIRTDDKSSVIDICLNPTFEGFHREILMLRLEFDSEHHEISYKTGNSKPLKHMAHLAWIGIKGLLGSSIPPRAGSYRPNKVC